MRQVVTLIVEAAFAVVFGQALVAYLRRRDRLQRDVMFVFTAMAVVFVLELWRRTTGPPPAWVSGMSTVLLLAQPYLTLRLVVQLRPVARGLRVAALVAFALSAAPFLPGRQVPVPLVLVAVAAFVGVEMMAAGFLYAEARRRAGSPRIRLAAAAAATGAFAVAILAAGAGAGQDGDTSTAGAVALALALASGVGYLVAFVPPGWMRRSWSTSATYAVTRQLLNAPAGEAPDDTWQRYVDTVREVTGSDAAVVLLGARPAGVHEAACSRMPADPTAVYPMEMLDGLLAAPQPVNPDAATESRMVAALAARADARHLRAVPLRLRSGNRGALVVLNTHRRLFSHDDVTLMGELGGHAGLLAERGTLLTEQERLNAELAASVDALSLANKAKSDFLSNMSHELRTPLNAILGFSELMDTGDIDAAGQRPVPAEWIGHIRRSGQHLLDLINDILDLAKVEAGRMDLKLEPLPLPATAAEVVTTLRAVSDRKGLHVTTDVPAVTVMADRIRLRQVLDNLLSNAIKFTPDGGRIHVSAEETDTEVRLTVADTGVGIAPEDQKTVFDEFTQVGDHKARQAGTGLGLALTRRLVEAHGGSIQLRSEPGVGSWFTICLPRQAEVAVPVDAEAVAVPGTVLVIEDDPAAADLLIAYLTEVGYPASVAASGEHGLRYARLHHPQAILLDILLPDTDGFQLLRAIRSDPAIRDTPVIVTTVLDEHDIGLAFGAVDYLTKPVNPDALMAVLTRHALLPPPPATATVLAVDDDPATLELVSATLSRRGVRTTTAGTGSAGVDLARRHRYDLIICDLMLPDIDGFAVIASLNADPVSRNTPILVLTGADLTDADKARLSGHVIDIVRKGDNARDRLRDWLSRLTTQTADTQAPGASGTSDRG